MVMMIYWTWIMAIATLKARAQTKINMETCWILTVSSEQLHDNHGGDVNGNQISNDIVTAFSFYFIPYQPMYFYKN